MCDFEPQKQGEIDIFTDIFTNDQLQKLNKIFKI